MKRAGFTLVELMVATAITALLVVLLATIGESATRAWRQGAAQAETYSNSRGAISILGRELESAVIDLDIGFRVDTVTGEPGNTVLKFLRRTTPGPGGAVEKTAYQLAWASDALIPTVRTSHDDTHTIPVLIRSTSTNLTDVYQVDSPGDMDAWTRNWGTLPEGTTVATGTPGGSDGSTIIEVAAEHVLGWRVTPKYWNGSAITSDDRNTPRYYGRYLTSDQAPGALEIRLAVTSSQTAPQLKSFGTSWSGLRSREDLFDPLPAGNTPFENLLRQSIRHFGSTYYLSSRTP